MFAEWKTEDTVEEQIRKTGRQRKPWIKVGRQHEENIVRRGALARGVL